MTQRLWLPIPPLPCTRRRCRAASARKRRCPPPQPVGPVQGILQNENQDQPIQIDAATLEVRDKEKMATFSGDVQVVQGDTTIKCQKLVVFYGPEPGAAGRRRGGSSSKRPHEHTAAAGGMPRAPQDIRRIEARGGVTVISKDQTASGDTGVYDLKTKTITLILICHGPQGKNVLHGERVVVDTVSGNAHFEFRRGARRRSRPCGDLAEQRCEGRAPNTMSIGPAKPN